MLASNLLTIPVPPTRDDIEQAIVSTIAYVDVFDYPLLASEIHRYLIGIPLSLERFQRHLDRLMGHTRDLTRARDYYVLRGREDLVATRRSRQAESSRLWPEAIRYGRLIARLPFVRMVAVTGSLAVNNVGRHRDIDFLIVTADDYLWLARAMTIAVVQMAARRGLELCPNYFLTERSLAIADQNLYTAHEIAQMVPLAGRAVYERFREANRWTAAYLPNAGGPPRDILNGHGPVADRHDQPTRLGQSAEALLRTAPGQWLNAWEMDRKIRKLTHASGDASESLFTADCCKGHFQHHQARALQAYEDRLATKPDPSQV